MNIMTSLGERIIVLVDLDCFFCQVEAKFQPELKGKPFGVVQYNRWDIGKIIAASYEARKLGVHKPMLGAEAKEKCPDLVLVSVPVVRGKSDISRYRNAGREVVDVLKKHSATVERASIDEAYVDITENVDKRMSTCRTLSKEIIKSLSNTFVVGYSEAGKNDEEQRSEGLERWINAAYGELEDIQSQRLAIAGTIIEDMRTEVFEKTGYRCSAGISYNKILAKLACGLHKPYRQTILPATGVASLFLTLPVKKVKNLGGKLGDVLVESLKCNVMADLLPYSLQYLQARFEKKAGLWLYNIARGIDNEPVTTRYLSKSIACCKEFSGKTALTTKQALEYRIYNLATEMTERLEQDIEENERRATQMTVSFHFYRNEKTVRQSRSCPLTSHKVEKIVKQSVDIITKSTKHPVTYIGLSAGKFVQANRSGGLINFFKVNNHEGADATQCSDMTVGSERDTTISVPSVISRSNLINSKENLNSSLIINTDHPKNICATKHEIMTGNSTLDNEFIDNTKITYKSADKKTDYFVKICKSSNDSGDVEGNLIFRNKKYSSSGNLQLDNKEGSPLLSEKVLYEPEIRSEATKHCQIENDFAPVSPLTNSNNALHPDNFKKSFFMNIFNQSNATSNTSNSFQRTVNASNVHDTLSENDFHTENVLNPKMYIEENDVLESCGEESSEDGLKTTNIRSTSETIDKERLMRNETDDVDHDYMDHSRASTNRSNISTNTDIFSIHDSSAITSSTNSEVQNGDRNVKRIALGSSKRRVTIRGEKSPDTNSENCLESDISNGTPNSSSLGVMSSSSVDMESTKTVNDQSTSVQLQEIFPDLNNIDQSIVALLPLKLQREANLLLKAQKENSTRATENSVKLQKSKSNKSMSIINSKSVTSRNTNKINSFFKKSNPISGDHIGPTEKCSECSKLIPFKSYLEHMDFHVAQSLQKEINNSSADSMTIKKIWDSKVDANIKSDKRKNIRNEPPKNEKKFKSITSFFS